ncbi:small multidrug resistance protein [Brevibacterium ravenspurgense]|uniref:Small multidrug resistance protein n=1 Tax=Brevibacterium ravenspurgense TaxID=479117 RepID=A0A2I1IJ50_9MICO|nr:SMR family transporter [Brevibacterium ravenspurgense]PKY71166.1 small multidrug resistance protein [Brevibacterium ravenspurgense]
MNRLAPTTRTGAWIVLLISGGCESLWAHALSSGLGSIGWILLFYVGLFVSLTGLRMAMRIIPMGTAYAMWTGIGAATTAVWAAAAGEPFPLLKIASLVLVVIGVAGLELTSGHGRTGEGTESRED